MRIAFFGDGVWAANCLSALRHSGHEIAAVIVRHTPSDDSLRRCAEGLDLPVHQPGRVNEPSFVEQLKHMTPDLNVSMSYDQILKPSICGVAPFGFINCHAGKLPMYRGRNPINWALINNEAEIGLTVHYVDEGIDTGDIILQRVIPIAWEDTYGSLLARASEAFPALLTDAVALIQSGTAPRTRQSHLPGSYFRKRRPGDEWIDWGSSSLEIYNKIRAITRPGPGARTRHGAREVIIWRASYDRQGPPHRGAPGEVVERPAAGGVRVKTGDSTLVVEHAEYSGDASTERLLLAVGTRLTV